MRDQIRREAEEAERELEELRLQQEAADAERLEQANAPLVSKDINELFPEEATADVVVPPVTEVPVPAATDESATVIAQLREELRRSEDRYRSTFGNFNKEGFAKLTEEIEGLKKQLAEKNTPAPEPTPEVKASLEELTAEVGAKGASIITALQKQIASLETSLNEVTGQVTATGEKTGRLEQEQAQTAAKNYFTSLNELVPDWRKINGDETTPQDPKFTEFAFQTIPGSDETYDKALKRHHSKGNAAKVAEIFNLFKKTVAPVAAAEPTPEEIATEPTRTGGGTPPPQPKPTKRIYTQAQIDEFDRLKKEGKLKGTPEQIAAINDDINDAIIEGRVR